MKLTVESTEKVMTLESGQKVRVWQGETANGVPVLAFVAYVMPTIPADDPRQAEFVAELEEHTTPGFVARAIDARFIW